VAGELIVEFFCAGSVGAGAGAVVVVVPFGSAFGWAAVEVTLAGWADEKAF